MYFRECCNVYESVITITVADCMVLIKHESGLAILCVEITLQMRSLVLGPVILFVLVKQNRD